MILGYCIASYVIMFFVVKWSARKIQNHPGELRLLSGFLWLMSPILVPAFVAVGLLCLIGLIIDGGEYK